MVLYLTPNPRLNDSVGQASPSKMERGTAASKKPQGICEFPFFLIITKILQILVLWFFYLINVVVPFMS